MMGAAIAMINRTGLTVSLDHISFEDVIRDADVSRSTAYRHWPHKDLFFSDLVIELAQHADLTIISDEIALMKRVLAEHVDWLDTPQQRHSLILELIRQLALLDFETVLNSPRWRTYLALHATFSSLADGALRDQVQAALAQAEASRTAQIAEAWRQLADLFGYRLRPELDTSFDILATLLSATLRGLIITALANPGIAKHRTVATPLGAAGKEQWSLPAISIASIATTFLEPNPTTEWNEQRLAEIHRALDAWIPYDLT
jgi:AcrR family transcriptional regulator